MLTEKGYGEISQEVYRVDSNATDYDPNLKEKATREIEGEKYKVLKTEDNTSNGMQAMAIAPVKDGTKNEADTSEVVIAYAGTNFGDITDINTDLQNVIIGNEEKLYSLNKEGNYPIYGPYVNKDLLSILGGEDLYGWDKVGEMQFSTVTDSQISTAEQFARRIQMDYPAAEITTTGHSLGEFLALDVAAENQWKNVGFNGPDPYDILSPEAKEWVENNSDKLFNYRNKIDPIGNYGGNGTGAGIPVDMDMSVETISKQELNDIGWIDLISKMDLNDLEVIIDSQRIGTWEFDEDGNLDIDSSYDNKEAFQTQGEKLLYGKLAELSLLAGELQASGGGMTSNELIFLNNAQALLTVEYITESTNAVIESIVNIYKDAIDELEETWEKNIIIAQAISTELSYGEILEALEA